MDVLRVLGLLLFGMGLTWVITVLIGRFLAGGKAAAWAWSRLRGLGLALTLGGFGLALFGLNLGEAGAPLLLLGSLVAMVGIALFTLT